MAAIASDHVKTLTTEASAAKGHEARACKAESDLKSAQELIQVMTDQADAITTERNTLRDNVKDLLKKVDRRITPLRTRRKVLKKEKKFLERSEECFFTLTNNLMGRVAEVGLDHKLVTLEGLHDPVDKEAVLKEPLVVSYASEAKLYD